MQAAQVAKLQAAQQVQQAHVAKADVGSARQRASSTVGMSLIYAAVCSDPESSSGESFIGVSMISVSSISVLDPGTRVQGPGPGGGGRGADEHGLEFHADALNCVARGRMYLPPVHGSARYLIRYIVVAGIAQVPRYRYTRADTGIDTETRPTTQMAGHRSRRAVER